MGFNRHSCKTSHSIVLQRMHYKSFTSRETTGLWQPLIKQKWFVFIIPLFLLWTRHQLQQYKPCSAAAWAISVWFPYKGKWEEVTVAYLQLRTQLQLPLIEIQAKKCTSRHSCTVMSLPALRTRKWNFFHRPTYMSDISVATVTQLTVVYVLCYIIQWYIC